MRLAPLIALLALTTLAPQTAQACKPFGPGFDSPAPVVLWSAPPPVSILAPGDSVLRVKFNRIASENDPRDVDRDHPDAHRYPATEYDAVIITCFAPSIYTVLEVMDGDDPGGSILMWGIHARGEGYDQFLVGRIAPLKDTARNGAPLAADSPRYMIFPRGPG